jgi:hypothetical protein
MICVTVAFFSSAAKVDLANVKRRSKGAIHAGATEDSLSLPPA